MSGWCNSRAEFSEHHDGDAKLARGMQNRKKIRIFVREGRKCIGVQDHSQISGSIFSKAPSIDLLTRFVSSCNGVFQPGLLSCEAADFNFSSTASVTNWRRGTPSVAALDLARRKIASGISSVVLMARCSHIYGV